MPITKVEKHTVGDGQVGPVAKKLHKSFEELVKKECEKEK
jgi:branched-subunit amino acid aminotransferase/4-amino-4-deoxychorismate lyase